MGIGPAQKRRVAGAIDQSKNTGAAKKSCDAVITGDR
jgi:hypothetical protein